MYVAPRQRRRWRRLKRLALAFRDDERGFTLIELLVASVAGIVVTAAMGAIVITSVHFSSNYNDRVDANQEARTAMEKITQSLNSSCVAGQVPPIQSTGATGPPGNPAISDGSHLWFYTAVAPQSAVTDGFVINPYLAEVYLSGNQLNESAYPWLSGTAPAPTNATPWTFQWGSPQNFTLLPSVTYAPALGSTGTTGPIFQYYGYQAGTGTVNTTPFSTPLSTANAAATAQVVISFRTIPADNFNAGGRATDLSDSVVLRLTPASSQSAVTNAPCS